jgi:hypothetical protein
MFRVVLLLARMPKYSAELGLCRLRGLIAKARVQPQASPFGICDGQSGI